MRTISTAGLLFLVGCGALPHSESYNQRSGGSPSSVATTAPGAYAVHAPEGSISGSSAILPPGALAIGATVTLEQRDDLATPEALSDLEIDSAAPAGAAVVLLASADVNAKAGSSAVTLPLSGASLSLADGDLAVVYSVEDSSGQHLGSLVRDSSFVEKDGHLTFSFTYPGAFRKASFQAVRTAVAVTPAVTAAEVAPAPVVTTAAPAQVVATPANTPSPCLVAGGVELAGGCWFLGAMGGSCSEACSTKGLAYDDLTRTYAGSGGSLAQCEAVIADLAAANSVAIDPKPTLLPSGNAGCQLYNTNPRVRSWAGALETNADYKSTQRMRVCACK